jgi:hypothetical protein
MRVANVQGGVKRRLAGEEGQARRRAAGRGARSNSRGRGARARGRYDCRMMRAGANTPRDQITILPRATYLYL